MQFKCLFMGVFVINWSFASAVIRLCPAIGRFYIYEIRRHYYNHQIYRYWGNVVIPDAIDGKPVLYIGDSAFAYCSGLTSVTIPNSVTSIGDSAFYHCSGLTSVTIPNSVTSIGDYAFADCSGLTSVTIPGSVTSIGDYAFSCCSGLTSVTIPDSVTSIGDYAFSGCSSLTIIAVDANNTVYSSQDGVLCNKNITVLIQYPVGKYGGFTIPGSVTIIGDSAFYDCSGLTSVTIPGSVTSIGVEAFSGCSGLTSVTIPDSVTSIGDYAFSGCSSLTIIAVDANNTVYSSQDGVLCNKNRTVLIQYPVGKYGGFTIPGSVTSIGVEAFSGCSGLTSVTIPDSVMSIGDSAFYHCSGLTSVTIPNSVTSIGSYAFEGCSGLTSAYFYGNAPSMGDYVFDGCSSNFIVCYTAGSTGFANPWYGYPASVCAPIITTTAIPTTSSTTTMPILTTTITSSTTTVQPVSTTTTQSSGGGGGGSPSTTTVQLTTSTSIVAATTSTSIITSTSTASTAQTTTSIVPSTTTSTVKLCPIIFLAEGEPEKLSTLRRFRDMVLMNTAEGRKHAIQFYKHSPELTSILLMNPSLAVQFRDVLNTILPNFKSALKGKEVALSAIQINKIISAVDTIERESSPALQQDLQQLKLDIQSGVIFNTFR